VSAVFPAYWKKFGPRLVRKLSIRFSPADFVDLSRQLESIAGAPVHVRASGLPSATTYLMVSMDGAVRIVFSFLDDPWEPESLMTIHDIVVPEAQRGKGTGTTIIALLLDFAERKGIHIATVHPPEEVRAFWRRFGFAGDNGLMRLPLRPKYTPKSPRVHIHHRGEN
jgi:GNAT superfamily N-acetyltransferase